MGLEVTLGLLFQFSGLSSNINGELRSIPALPSNWAIDWRQCYDFKTPNGTPNFEFHHSRKLDPFLTPSLHQLPGFLLAPRATSRSEI
jgi:hypothetical protein